MISTTVLTLLVIPAIYSLWKERHVSGREPVAAVGEVLPAGLADGFGRG